ncbi:PKD domain-containing protein [Terrimonas sp. NA20]|uniref:PKD domain-containing protein n=1 Tax=Terrimonas ginsenosidimutans TaxID=2908004 RepID=A0ABS9KPA5_9BACT|nr:PKD domain-containing protein [Terrimonas ginsenosidimutans]MCG2614162.1 PKD domain-containing protein [Terrimonas ginsenosidimutans]
MKKIVLSFTLLITSLALYAEHITGGEMYYTFAGVSNGVYKYNVTLKLFRNCGNTGAALDQNAAIGIFDNTTNSLLKTESVQRSSMSTLSLQDPGPCITNAPSVCYEVGFYEFTVELPASARGYTISYQRCCRINGISNVVGSGSYGATYTAIIPGTNTFATAPENNSAKFSGRDTVIICGGYPFTYSFAATDADPTDQLRYSFCNAYSGGGQDAGPSGGQNTPIPNPPAAPPYSQPAYSFPYNGPIPLGTNVSINPTTGLITGTAPPEGIYVVTVCVEEIRNGVVIAVQRKDLQIKAGGCDIARSLLDPVYTSCDGLTLDFANKFSSPLISTYYWEFGDPASGAGNSSTSATPTHTFSTPGDYTIKLVTNRNQECSDSTTALVRVWPGFFPAFNTTGICINNPVLFTDASTTNYGVIDSWSWSFGDETTLADTSHKKDTSWKYNTTGPKEVIFTVTSDKGCFKTLKDTITIIDKPPITLGFRDTLICVPDAVQLQASGTGNFSWSPTGTMVNANTGTPTVSPPSTTTYQVTLNEQGCINQDTVRVRVVQFVSMNAMADSVICETDPAQLHVTSDALRFDWSPAAAVSNPTIPNPIALAGSSLVYSVTGSIGSCNTTRNIRITAIPYPVANAGPDTIICYNTPAPLHGTHDGSLFNWSPTASLVNSQTLNPVAYPARTTEYILRSFDTRGCPKPGIDTVLVTVLPKIRPFAGNDTAVIAGQPLQFNAEGGVNYIWTPSTGLSNANIKNPIGVYGAEIDSIRYTVEVFNEAGCSDTASMKVTVFKTNPYVFVPSAFTPNGDGKNDLLIPVAVGVRKINYFRIYNRWGNLLFSTTTNGHGWDGNLSGTPQTSNVFVWMVEAEDYTGKKFTLKGTTTLIR